jgi:type IV pilus assembly protein PilX
MSDSKTLDSRVRGNDGGTTSIRNSSRPATPVPHTLRPPRAQQGIALVVALILLVIITLVGLAAVSGTIMQNKMASNQYDRQIAFQSAESTLRQARTWLLADDTDRSAIRDCTQRDNPCASNPFADGGAGTTADKLGDLATDSPEYIVEKVALGGGGTGTGCDSANGKQRNAEFNGACLDTVEAATYYRITARSGDPTQVGDRAIVTLQSVIRVQ